MQSIFIKALFGALAVMAVVVPSGRAQIPLSQLPYTQNFNSLPSVTNRTWKDNITLLGWYAAHQAGKEAPLYGSIRVSDGSTNTGWIYSFGNKGQSSSDRALGSIVTSTPQFIAYGVRFTNDTDKVLGRITVTYTGEQWRNGATEQAQKLTFSYRISASPLTSPEPGIEVNWAAFPRLDFTTPRVGLGMFPLDGNEAGNRTKLSDVVLQGVVVKPGEELFLRWTDINDPQNDSGIAVDDFELTAVPTL